MNFILNIKIRVKLLIGFGIMILLMGIIGYTGYRSVAGIQKNLQEIFAVQMPSIDLLIEADRDLQQLLVAERSMLFADPGSPIFDSFLKEYKDNFEQSDTRWKSYKAIAGTEKEKQIFPEYDKARKAWESSSKKVIDLAQKNENKALQQAKELSLGEAKKQFEHMRGYINQLTEINLELADSANENAEATYGSTVKIILGVILLGAFIGVGLGLGMSRLITGPVNAIVHGLRDIAKGEGDLTKRLEQSSKDEIGELASWFNIFMDKLQNLIKDISDGVETLSSSSSELSSISGEMTQGAQDVSNRSDTVSAATEEMNANMGNVASAMEQSSANTDTVATAAEEMNVTINEIAKNAGHARNISDKAVTEVDDSTRKMDELGEAARAIGKVVETINDISEQVNLLSLNATIEAARAGEAGKGFAVVAGEIKDLAGQTSAASMDIKQKIDNIQESASSSLSGMTGIADIISNVNDIVATIAAAVEEQSSATREIAENVSQVSAGIQEVNVNVSQTSAVTGEISKDISRVNQSASDMAERSEQVNGRAVELSQLAVELKQLVNQFKI
ncbi:HAMP domain-containing methyl-accepting chemotaxis protein [Desulfospira joergensenii]|uniref:HAMP domain-containing methyl-accepting chemotaxis protein n=1 Tax=Desulfospira joergensenii TaxID=53329 RepID=UPI0003B4CB52|nr:methyl-accepting chemotaxis protein [Desulfospira joergensenii]